ncbi:Sec1-like protein [Multifurca ochricompacta]|uniref:Sec1-like protein n=1 Tax=Multifurca ochricompacta TaxID=376703 RepID=A0AAD4QUB2_9AGAM|nr:Sec1-like protein [Multifurca ochricompacta]
MTTSSSSSGPHQRRPSVETVDVSILREVARSSLVHALNSVNGAKTLVLDPSLAGPLSLVTEVSLLQQHGVDKMFWLEPGPLSAVTTNILYLCRPRIKWVKIISDQIKRHSSESQKHTYTLLLVPRTSTLMTRLLEEEGVLGDITISSYNLQFIPIADDVVSLENTEAFKEIWVDGDETSIFDSSQALHTLQKLFGLFPRIIGKGDFAGRLADLLARQTTQRTSADRESLLDISDKFDSLIVIDRRVDMITPLLTQLTYEGLIDEVIHIQNSHIEVPASLLNAPTNTSAASSASTPPAPALAQEKKRKHHLSASTDPIFAELRDLNFASVGKRLNKAARRLDEDYRARHQASVSQLRDFVGKLGGLQAEHRALQLHTGLSEIIMPITRSEIFNKSLEIQQNLLASYDIPGQLTALEDLIAQGADMQLVFRLVCLASITSGGIKSKTLEVIKKEVLQAYGYSHLPLLLSLAAPPLAILLPNPLPPSTPAAVAGAKYPYTSLRRSLRLLIDGNESLDELENDISYHSAVQCVAQKGGVLSNPAKSKEGVTEEDGKKGKLTLLGQTQAHPIIGFKGFEDVVESIAGRTFDITQKGVEVTNGASTALLPTSAGGRTTTTVVFFLGGCTYTEIAALRWAGRQTQGRNFLIATTGMVSGGSMIESISGVGGADVNLKEANL